MSSTDTDSQVMGVTNIKRIDVFTSECAESGESVAILEVIDLDDQGYSLTLTLDQVMDTIMLLTQLRNCPPSFQARQRETLVLVDSIELLDFPEVN